jgi:predicted SnoaL-like aldol condensation-catalyzing enzyme
MATSSKPSSEDRVQTVLNAFDTLFNKRDYASAERFWSPRYIQHSAHIPAGRDGLFDLVRSLPATLRYENHVAAAMGDFVILHGRFSGHGLPAAWVVADIVRMGMACSRSIGMSSRTRPRGNNRAAVCRCSATNSRPEQH